MENKYTDKRKNYMHKYYLKNKEMIYSKQQEYRLQHQEEIKNKVIEYRKKRALQLKEKGQIGVWLSKKGRENMMTLRIAKLYKINNEQARELLEQNNWNYKKLEESANNDIR